MKLFKNKKLSLSFKIIFIVVIILTVSLTATFYFMGKKYEGLLISQLKSQARILFNQILLTRKWVADHGGVFVEQTLNVIPNPYLEKSTIIDTVGKKYITENPAFATRELSDYPREEGVFWYHITSLKLVNPDNAPDEFERNALERFENHTNVKELYKIEKIKGHSLLRYVAPLYIEPGCMKCHAKHGYKIGDIRGAISITIPVDKIFEEINNNKKSIIIFTYIVLAVITLILLLSIHSIVIHPIKKLTWHIRDYGKKKQHSEDIIRSGDEIEDLSNAFANMANKLSKSRENLDSKVQEATKNLQDMNDKLIEANRKLETMYREKSDFVASVSHEMRTPLTSIKGSMEYIFEKIKTIKSEDKTASDIKEFIGIVKKQADRLVKTFNDTIDLEKIELFGKGEMHINPANLTKLINETVKGFMTNLTEKNIVINLSSEDVLITCFDEDRIRQVLINLINNAINYSPNYETIEIKSFKENGWIITEICDNGPGIDVSEREKIFKKYYKKEDKNGSGLGLAICKVIIEAHGGEIGVKDGKGSTFYFKIPLIGGGGNEEVTCS